MLRRFINWCLDGYKMLITENEKQRKSLEDEIIKALDKKDFNKAAMLQQIMDDRFRR